MQYFPNSGVQLFGIQSERKWGASRQARQVLSEGAEQVPWSAPGSEVQTFSGLLCSWTRSSQTKDTLDTADEECLSQQPAVAEWVADSVRKKDRAGAMGGRANGSLNLRGLSLCGHHYTGGRRA